MDHPSFLWRHMDHFWYNLVFVEKGNDNEYNNCELLETQSYVGIKLEEEKFIDHCPILIFLNLSKLWEPKFLQKFNFFLFDLQFNLIMLNGFLSS